MSKSRDGKGISIPKKRQLKIDTSFLSKKPKQQHRLGSYPITAKYSRSSKETSAKSTSQCDQEIRIASPLKQIENEMSKLDEHVITVYKGGSINLPQIHAEWNSVKGICNGLNKYCDDVKEMVKQVEEAVKNAKNSNRKVNVATQNLKHPYKWKCNTCTLTFRTTTNLYDHKKVHENSRFPCRENNCDKTFANQSSCQIHEMKHKKEKTKMCDQCFKLFYHESELKNHQLIHASPSFACDKCNVKFTQKSERNRHSKTCGTQVQCLQCPNILQTLNISKNILSPNMPILKLGDML